MLELRVSNGDDFGPRHLLSQSLVRIGRNPSSDLVLVAPGVWERHAEILPSPDGRFLIRAVGEGLVYVGKVAVTETVLRLGDRISIGSVDLEFQIPSPDQRALAGTELFLWFLAGAAIVGQAALVFALGR